MTQMSGCHITIWPRSISSSGYLISFFFFFTDFQDTDQMILDLRVLLRFCFFSHVYVHAYVCIKSYLTPTFPVQFFFLIDSAHLSLGSKQMMLNKILGREHLYLLVFSLVLSFSDHKDCCVTQIFLLSLCLSLGTRLKSNHLFFFFFPFNFFLLLVQQNFLDFRITYY